MDFDYQLEHVKRTFTICIFISFRKIIGDIFNENIFGEK